MNFAQCIDPEWAQEMSRKIRAGASPAPAPAEPEPQRPAEPEVVTHRADPPRPRGSGVGGQILKVLAAAEEGLIVSEIAELAESLTSTQVATNVPGLCKRGDVRRSGPSGYYTYRITARGRKRIAPA